MIPLLPNVDPTRKGDWIQTFTGKCFWPLDPRPEDVCIEDIAHALSMKCRYAGHTKHFYSVAEHSVFVSRHVPAEHALWGLLHDAAEAYSADIPRPLKSSLSGWSTIEARIMQAIIAKFNLDPVEPVAVKRVDNAILGDEKRGLMAPCGRDWGLCEPPLGIEIWGYSPRTAEHLFLSHFHELTE